MSEYHNPVLFKESIEGLAVKPAGVYADATFGGGGHSRGILEALSGAAKPSATTDSPSEGPVGKLLAFDQDADALLNAPDDARLIPIHANFRFIHNFSLLHAPEGLDGVIADLGVSSHQFDTPDRGFSFRFSAPLDMRMNVQGDRTAADIANSYTQEELERMLRLYGEVDSPRRIAQLIVAYRSKKAILTTDDLDDAVRPALPDYLEHKVLARIYQAFRIEVNSEMRALEKFLSGAAASLKKGGRLVVITYHSLEDRMVKNFIRSGNISGEIYTDIYGRSSAPLKAVNRKPILPSEDEIASNTRARSAKLRIAERI
ncbi:MAG: 16S rRNA (cytosine(1402)-N(4))-methyltransferase RsmH [Bacteroidales bacterium]|nr:16S rRNA (cytosine(1402)-N(4))-methyltransferase RsmH [Bacteroidales bacterium]